MFPLSFLFNQGQGLGLASEIFNGVISLTFVPRLGEMIQAAENHLQGDVLKGPVQGISHGSGQVNQEGVEQPGGPDLHLNAVARTGVKISQAPQSFDDVKSILDAPAWS